MGCRTPLSLLQYSGNFPVILKDRVHVLLLPEIIHVHPCHVLKWHFKLSQTSAWGYQGWQRRLPLIAVELIQKSLHSSKPSSFMLCSCTKRQEFDPGGEGTMLWPSSAHETIPSYCIDGGKEDLLYFIITQQRLCLCECWAPQGLSGLLMDKRMLRVGNLKSMRILG